VECTIEQVEGGYHHLNIPEALVETLNGQKRLLCTLKGQTFHCALLRKGGVQYYVYLNKGLLKKLDLEIGMTVEASFKPDDSSYGCEMPEAFAEVLASDPEADRIFHSLTPGNQRGLIYLVTQVKSVDKRIERALRIAEGLKMGVTSPRTILKR